MIRGLRCCPIYRIVIQNGAMRKLIMPEAEEKQVAEKL